MTDQSTALPALLDGAGHTWNARRIAALRERRGWTQETLAERSGLSVRTIRNLELGVVQNPRRSSVDLLAHALGVRVEGEREREYQPAATRGRALWRGPRPPASVPAGDPVEFERVARSVCGHRLTTLLGPGGIGKTRTALHLAAQLGHAFRHGVAVVELGDLTPERANRAGQEDAVMDRVRRYLGPGTVAGPPGGDGGEQELNLLLVLDNAEHVPHGVTAVARELLATHPGLQVLITARRRLTERLGVNLEVQPLATGPVDGGVHAGTPAVDLMLRHLGAEARCAVERDGELPLLGELCRRLGGLPRYLEFAAERLRTIPVQQLLAYGPTVEMLWSNDHALLPHQRSAADSIRWDVDLLGAEHGRLLERIAGRSTRRFTLDDVAAEFEGAGMTGANPLALLSDLHEASLVLVDPDDRYRYRLAPFVSQVVERGRAAHGHDELDRWRRAVAS